MKQLTIQSLGFLIRFQEDDKILWPHEAIKHTVTRVSYRMSRRCQNHHHHHHHHHLGLPGRSLRVRANLRASGRNIISYNTHI